MFEHIFLAVLIQALVAIVIRNRWAGAVAACAWALSREITQAEYRWIETYGSGLRANMPWWGGLDARVWHKVDPWLDWLVPSLVAVGIAMIAGAYGNRGGAAAKGCGPAPGL